LNWASVRRRKERKKNKTGTVCVAGSLDRTGTACRAPTEGGGLHFAVIQEEKTDKNEAGGPEPGHSVAHFVFSGETEF